MDEPTNNSDWIFALFSVIVIVGVVVSLGCDSGKTKGGSPVYVGNYVTIDTEMELFQVTEVYGHGTKAVVQPCGTDASGGRELHIKVERLTVTTPHKLAERTLTPKKVSRGWIKFEGKIYGIVYLEGVKAIDGDLYNLFPHKVDVVELIQGAVRQDADDTD